MTERSVCEPPQIAPQLRALLQTALLAWYDLHKRDLPWRRSRDPYAIWISEVMLQQTQVITMEPYYRRFMEHFPDIASLAAAPLERVLKMWQGLGYYSRARHLHQAARIVRDAFAGRVPDQWHQLRALPGIGDYIAAALLSIAFGSCHAVVDGNVKRVLARLFTFDGPIDTPGGHRFFQRTAALLLEPNRPGDYNQALMELGARICSPRRPACPQCPLMDLCRARAQGVTDRFPQRRPRPSLPVQRAAAVLLTRGRRILLVQRPLNGLLGGLWELPGGPLAPEMDPAAAVGDHVRERLGLAPQGLAGAGTLRHGYTHFKLELTVFRAAGCQGRLKRARREAARWVLPEKLHALPLHKAALKALRLLGFEGDSGVR